MVKGIGVVYHVQSSVEYQRNLLSSKAQTKPPATLTANCFKIKMGRNELKATDRKIVESANELITLLPFTRNMKDFLPSK